MKNKDITLDKEWMRNILKNFTLRKLDIFFLIDESNHPLNISEIQRELGISYKETYRNIKELIDAGFLSRVHKIKEKHQPVYINIKNK